MKFDDARPIYLQIVEYYKQEIIRGNLKVGDKMPSVREAARDLAVNPNTLQRAYSILESEGVTRSERGKGFFVNLDRQDMGQIKEDMALESIDKAIKDLKKINLDKDKALRLIEERW
ncbi:MAG: GntR family transcriptional regulator [Finegoldia sp.]|nr:GntR family transcriptional regulator [Finegoldia sp.]